MAGCRTAPDGVVDVHANESATLRTDKDLLLVCKDILQACGGVDK
jgi:hypothetical protein